MLKNKHVSVLNSIFKKHSNFHKAHEEAQVVLLEMARDRSFLMEIIKKHVGKDDYFELTKDYTTTGFEICKTKDFHFLAHVFPSHPKGHQDLSFQSVHHHGNLILSSVCAYGPGYESLEFSSNYHIDENSHETNLEITKYFIHKPGQIEFIDVQTPHVVFYPKDITITYALWSSKNREIGNILKNNRILRAFKKPLKKGIKMLGMEKKFALNDPVFYDFYPSNGKMYGLRDRIHYTKGTNQQHVKETFRILENIQFDDKDFIKTIIRKTSNEHVKKWGLDFINGIKIESSFVGDHELVGKINLWFKEIVDASVIPDIETKRSLDNRLKGQLDSNNSVEK